MRARCRRHWCREAAGMLLTFAAASSLFGVAAAPSVVDELPGMTRKAFGRWHEASLGVAAGDREWAKADKDEDGFVSEKERDDYEACCKFKPSAEAIKISLGEEDGVEDEDDDDDDEGDEKEAAAEQGGLRTLEAVEALVARFEAKEVTADEAKAVLRASLYALGTRRVQSGGNSYATMTTPVKTASLHELTQGTKDAIKQVQYEQRSREAAEAAGKAPPPACEDVNDDCGFFAEEGECENNQEWMIKNCPKSCGACIDETAFFEGGFVKHIKGKKGLKKILKHDSKMVVMFWTPGCKYCTAAKPQFAQGAEQAATELGDVIWAAVSDILAMFYHGLYAQLTALVCGHHPPTVDLLNRWTVRATKRSASSRAARSFRHSNSTPVLRIGKRARSRRCTIWRRTQRIRPFSAPRNTSRTSKNHSLRPNLSLGGAAAPRRISLMGSADVERSL